ncbi:hypothetical protein HOY80DRAFT_880550, partial [Tuber brumale]
FSFMAKCEDPEVCIILLRGPSKDIFNEIERNLHDARVVAHDVFFHPGLAPGGSSAEMAISVCLAVISKSTQGV